MRPPQVPEQWDTTDAEIKLQNRGSYRLGLLSPELVGVFIRPPPPQAPSRLSLEVMANRALYSFVFCCCVFWCQLVRVSLAGSWCGYCCPVVVLTIYGYIPTVSPHVLYDVKWRERERELELELENFILQGL